METSGSTAENLAITKLIAAKTRFLAPMIVIYMVSYIGLTVLAGFAKGFMAIKVVGSLNVGFALIGLNYVISWVLAYLYVRFANTVFDPMVERVIAEMKGGGKRS